MSEYIMRYENDVLQLMPDKIQPLVRCKDCIHRPKKPDDYEEFNSYDGFRLEFPDNMCPAGVEDGYYAWYPSDNFFCGYGKRSDGNG